VSSSSLQVTPLIMTCHLAQVPRRLYPATPLEPLLVGPLHPPTPRVLNRRFPPSEPLAPPVQRSTYLSHRHQ
ncbi:MAG: hypothetical protein NZ703_15060, partial [Gemmataceae bacterium]|nr:hypothetical protein [Gemmataceae bacterium]